MDIDSLMNDDWYSMCIDNLTVCCACKKITVCLQSGSGGLSVSNGGSSSSKTVRKLHWISKQVFIWIADVHEDYSSFIFFHDKSPVSILIWYI